MTARKYLYLILTFIFFLGNLQILPQYKLGKAQSLPKAIQYLGQYIYRVDSEGKLIHEEISQKEIKNYLQNYEVKPHLNIINSLNNPAEVRGLKIVLRASDQLLANKDALIAFRRAAARWERYITTKITAVIDVDYGDTRWGQQWDTGVLGSTNSRLVLVTYPNGDTVKVQNLVQALQSKHIPDSQLQELYSSIPIPTPSTAGTYLDVAIAGLVNFQELGILESEVNPDPIVNPFGTVPSIGFNSAFKFDFDPSDGINKDSEDFDAIVTHEIGHALGFNSIIGSGGPPYNYFTPWDLFRVRPEAVEPNSFDGFKTAERIVTPGPPPSVVDVIENSVTYYKANHVFFDGIQKIELSTATGSRLGGDGQQASHWRDDVLRPPSQGDKRRIGIMDPTSSGGGIREEIGTNDLRMLEVIGYDINYNQTYSTIMVVSGSDTLDISKSTDTLKIADVSLNGTKSIPIDLVNIDLNNALNYEAEIIIDTKRPSDALADISLDVLSGSIGSGYSSTINLTAGNSSIPAVIFGTLRLHTNDYNKLVIDIPIKVNIGGAVEPIVATDKMDLGSFTFENNSDKLQSKEMTIFNLGNIDLDYRVSLSLSDKSNYPVVPVLAKSNIKYSLLSHFFKKEVINSSEILYDNDFENGFSDFDTSGTKSEYWHIITTGPSLLEGHSKPSSAHFGIDYIDSIKYPNYSDSKIISKSFDFSSIPPQDLITLSFNYYLQAEEGYDFASVLVSLDDGLTFDEVATSNSGIIKNDTVWQSVIIQLPYLSGNPLPVRFAFRFTSDQLIEKEGWFIDDVELTVTGNANSIYTDVKTGKIIGLNSSNKINLFANAQQIEAGYYDGALSILSNDPVKPGFAIPFNIGNITIGIADKNVLYASTGRGTASKGKLLTIDKFTGVGTEIGSSGFEPLRSITISPDNEEIYGLNTSAFIPSSVVRINTKDAYGLFQFESKIKLTAIVFDKENKLLAAAEDKNLYKLDPLTGDTTVIGNIGFKVGAMTIEESTGDIIASIDATSGKDNLYRINPRTASSTLIGSTGLDKVTRGLVFDAGGNLFGVVGEDTQISTFFAIDKNSGTATPIGSVGYRGVVGLALSPDSLTNVNENSKNIPVDFALYQNYPNPFNPKTIISYQLAANCNITLKVFDIIGKEVRTLVNEEKQKGSYKVEFDGSNLTSGIYFFRLKAGNFISTRKMTLLK
jgi:hypothetical protein